MNEVTKLEQIAEAEKGVPLYRYWQIWSEYLKKEITFSAYVTPKLEAYRIKTHVRKPYESRLNS